MKKAVIKKIVSIGLSTILVALNLENVYSYSTSNAASTNTTTSPKIIVKGRSVSNYVPGELIVKYKSDTTLDGAVKKRNGKIEKKNRKLKIAKVKVSNPSKLQAELDSLKMDPNVEYVEPNTVYKLDYLPNDPSINSQWGLGAIKASQAWDTTTGSSSINIAVLDTGVDLDHPDLAAHLVTGYNAITATTNANDDHGHGTHVAGIAAGIIDNGKGTAGVAGNCSIIPVKVLGSTGSGSSSDIIEGIIWAADNGAKVINMSLGGTDYSQAYQDAVNYATNKGVLVIAAKGNSNTSAPHYPADLNNVVSVSAVDENYQKASFSNYGSVDIAAPGTNIYASTFDGSYGYKQGTSMATPFVAGLAGLIFSKDSTLTPSQVENLMKTTAVDLGTAGVDSYFGYGLIDAAAALGQEPDTTAIEISDVSVISNPFLLNGTVTTKLNFIMPENGYVTLKIYDQNNNEVRTLLNNVLKTKGFQSVAWNGKNNSAQLVAEGTYTYKLTVVDGAGNSSTPITGTVVADKTAPQITSVSASAAPFAATETNSIPIDYNLSEKSRVTIKVYSSTGLLINTLENNALKNAGDNTVNWDGKNSTGAVVNDGIYTIKVDAVNLVGLKALQKTITVTLDRYDSFITSVMDTPDIFKATGSTVTAIKYTTTQTASVSLNLYDSNDVLVKTLFNNSVNAGNFSVSWNGKDTSGNLVEDGVYTYKLNATNTLGNAAGEIIGTITVDKTAPSISNLNNNTALIKDTSPLIVSYTLSENAKVTVTIVDSANRIIKTLALNEVQKAGDNTVNWDGYISGTTLSADGGYKVVVKAVDYVLLNATPVMQDFTIDRFTPSITAVSDTADPFKVTGLTKVSIKYTLSESSVVTLKVYNSDDVLVKTLVNGVTKVGAQTVYWDGKDENGNLVEDAVYTYKIDAVDLAGNAASQASGTITTDKTPTSITAPSSLTFNWTTPGDKLDINYTLAEASKVTVTIHNSAGTLVRTLSNSAAQNAGANYVSWYGTNSSNYILPAGTYTFKIKAVDKVGFISQVSGSIAFNR